MSGGIVFQKASKSYENFLKDEKTFVRSDFYTLPYIHHNEDNVYWSLTKKVFDKNNNYFTDKANQMLNRYLDRLTKNIKVYKKTGENQLKQVSFAELVRNTSNPVQAAEDFGRAFAEAANQAVNGQQYTQSFNEALAAMTTGEVKNMFASGNVKDDTYESFKRGFTQLVNTVYKISPEELDGFFTLYREYLTNGGIAGERKISNELKRVVNINELSYSSQKALNQIIKICKQMPKVSSKKEFSDLMRLETSRKLGEHLSKMNAQMAFGVRKQVEDAFPGQGKTSARSTGSGKAKNIFGQQVTKTVDSVVKNGEIEININSQQIGEGKYILKGDFGINTKWYSDISKQILKGRGFHAKMFTTSSFTQYVKQSFPTGYQMGMNYAVYNSLAFLRAKDKVAPGEAGKNFRIMYNSVVVSHLEKILAGKQGESIVASVIDINGVYYPVISIIAEYIKTMSKVESNILSNKSSQGNLIVTKMDGLLTTQNDWYGSKEKNLQDALKRSQIAANKIDKIKISFMLNLTASKATRLQGVSPLKI